MTTGENRPIAGGRGPENLRRLLKKARERGQTRSVLAGKFAPVDIRVEAHARKNPPSNISREEQEGPAAWRGVTFRYSRLVQPTPVTPASLNHYVQRLRSLVGHPHFARLNHNKQLGTTCWAGGLGASHSRLEHTLGVLDIALILVDQLGRYMRQRNLVGQRTLAIQRAVLLLAFIHDAFHGPYGHTMDPIRSIIAPACVRDRLDKEALAHFIEKAAKEQSGWLFEALQLVYVKSERGPGNQAGLGEQELALDLEVLYEMYIKEEPSLVFAREIVESSIDADRLDYIPRDHAHIFLDSKVTGTNEIVRDALFLDDGSGTPHLHFSTGSVDIIESYLSQRLFLYDNVYESREKAPYDEMLIHAVLYLFADYSCGSPAQPFENEFTQRQEVFEEFVQLSDQDLERVFDMLEPTPKRVIAQLLVEDVRVHAPFQVVDLQPIPAIGLAAMLYRYQHLSERLKKSFLNLPPSVRSAFRWGTPASEWDQRKEAAKRVFQEAAVAVEFRVEDQDVFKALNAFGEGQWDSQHNCWVVRVGPPPNEIIYWMCMQLGNQISAKRNFEIYLWRELQLHWPGYKKWRADLKTAIIRRCGQTWYDGTFEEYERYVDHVIDTTPMVFVSCTRIAERLDDAMLRNRGAEEPILLWNEAGASIRHQVASTRSGRASYFAMLLAPATFGEDALEILGRIWNESIEALAWWAAPAESIA
jgi:HD superfamily phosphohydrolase